jgi:xylulokinase
MLLLDCENKKWSKKMCAICGVTSDMLPRLYESTDVTGKLKPEFGLKNAVMCAGAGDNAASAVGTGTLNDGDCSISLGTSGTVFLPTSGFIAGAGKTLHNFCHSNGRYHLMGCILSAASCDEWWTKKILKGKFDEFTTEKAAETGVYFLPYLTGERCPHNDGDVKGAFIGLTHSTSREDMQRAVFEGVSFAIKDCVELCPNEITKATVCGGGTKNRPWMQILADILGIELSVIDNEGPAYGGALLAAGIKTKPEIKYTVLPDKSLSDLYGRKYKKYRQLYPLLKGFYKED